ncbi:MAG: single-stranded DNA-binding protein [Alphaproteobacteria bacterium]|nr:single-stranded DNA-binding protein [Alphaproteobacteria bacterium]
MAGSVNKAIIMGNLGRDPEIRTLENGTKVANLSVATSETWRDKNSGERQERTQWHRVVVWNENLIKVIESYAKKGMKVYIEGQNETRKWTDNDGKDRYVTEIVLNRYRGEFTMVDRPDAPDSSEGDPRPPGGGKSKDAGGPIDDDIPF